jgi:hypothetical protein
MDTLGIALILTFGLGTWRESLAAIPKHGFEAAFGTPGRQ